jgi:hypothetical protein
LVIAGRHHRPLIGRNEPRVFHEIVVVKYSRIGAGRLMATPTQAGGVGLANGSQGDGYPLGFDRAPSWALAVAVQDDFNADDRSDILWRNDNGSLAIWTMNGTAITSGNNIASSPDATWHVNGVGDYNGGGKGRHSLAHDNAALAEWLMKGSNILKYRLIAGSDLAHPGPPLDLV